MTRRGLLTFLLALGLLAEAGCRSRTRPQPVAPTAKAPAPPPAKLQAALADRPPVSRPQYRTSPAPVVPAPVPAAPVAKAVAKKPLTLEEQLKVIPRDPPRRNLRAWEKRAQNF
jgi:hypothetical protein